MTHKLNRIFILAAVVAMAFGSSVHADVFNMGGTQNADGTWNGLASLEMVTVGNPGNAGEPSGVGTGFYCGPYRVCGAVDYVYQIGKFEVTNAQWREFLNAKAALDDPHGLYNTEMAGTYGGIARSGSGTSTDPYVYTAKGDDSNWDNRPVICVSFWDAARFCNWLHNGQGDGDTESGAYINIGNEDTFAREEDATWFIPTEDEWYKAAYHKNDGVTGNYYYFPTGTDSCPSDELVNPDPGNNANFDDMTGSGSIDCTYFTTMVGEYENSESPYGTFDQGGNILELTETVIDSFCVLRGGFWGREFPGYLSAIYRNDHAYPTSEYGHIGFRVASVAVPEPGSVALLAAIAFVALLYRKR